MSALMHSLAMFVIDFFKSPRRLEAENLFLRHQLSIALSAHRLRRSPQSSHACHSQAFRASGTPER
jgi:hypothetical protein